MKPNKYIYTAIKQNYTAIRLNYTVYYQIFTCIYTDTCMPPLADGYLYFTPLSSNFSKRNPARYSCVLPLSTKPALLYFIEAWNFLKKLSGVGPKVADCVCLMGLGYLEAVPVDTHMLRVTARDYGLKVPHSLTENSYSLVGRLIHVAHPSSMMGISCCENDHSCV
jgi:hypothetical protein